MISLRTRPPSSLGDVKRCLEELIRELGDVLDTMRTPNTLLTTGARGAGRTAMQEDNSGGGEAEAIAIEQWVATTSYVESDLAFCDTSGERDDGTQAGLYQCILDIAGDAGNDHPSVDTTHWRMVARGHWSKLTVRSGSTYMVIDTANAKVTLYDGTGSESTMDLSELGNHVAKFRETWACDTETNTPQLCKVFRSEYYDPPA